MVTYSYRSKNLSTCSNEHIVSYCRVSFACVVPSTSKSNSMIYNNSISNFCCFSDDNPHTVVDKNAMSNLCSWMDFYACKKSKYLRNKSSNKLQSNLM